MVFESEDGCFFLRREKEKESEGKCGLYEGKTQERTQFSGFSELWFSVPKWERKPPTPHTERVDFTVSSGAWWHHTGRSRGFVWIVKWLTKVRYCHVMPRKHLYVELNPSVCAKSNSTRDHVYQI